jgi:hypothetical protein
VLKDLKIDFPAILALNIFITFAVVIVCSMFLKRRSMMACARRSSASSC